LSSTISPTSLTLALRLCSQCHHKSSRIRIPSKHSPSNVFLLITTIAPSFAISLSLSRSLAQNEFGTNNRIQQCQPNQSNIQYQSYATSFRHVSRTMLAFTIIHSTADNASITTHSFNILGKIFARQPIAQRITYRTMASEQSTPYRRAMNTSNLSNLLILSNLTQFLQRNQVTSIRSSTQFNPPFSTQFTLYRMELDSYLVLQLCLQITPTTTINTKTTKTIIAIPCDISTLLRSRPSHQQNSNSLVPRTSSKKKQQ
jgi:hypothetical protein